MSQRAAYYSAAARYNGGRVIEDGFEEAWWE
jgi:hypothetical protein